MPNYVSNGGQWKPAKNPHLKDPETPLPVKRILEIAEKTAQAEPQKKTKRKYVRKKTSVKE